MQKRITNPIALEVVILFLCFCLFIPSAHYHSGLRKGLPIDLFVTNRKIFLQFYGMSIQVLPSGQFYMQILPKTHILPSLWILFFCLSYPARDMVNKIPGSCRYLILWKQYSAFAVFPFLISIFIKRLSRYSVVIFLFRCRPKQKILFVIFLERTFKSSRLQLQMPIQ